MIVVLYAECSAMDAHSERVMENTFARRRPRMAVGIMTSGWRCITPNSTEETRMAQPSPQESRRPEKTTPRNRISSATGAMTASSRNTAMRPMGDLALALNSFAFVSGTLILSAYVVIEYAMLTENPIHT